MELEPQEGEGMRLLRRVHTETRWLEQEVLWTPDDSLNTRDDGIGWSCWPLVWCLSDVPIPLHPAKRQDAPRQPCSTERDRPLTPPSSPSKPSRTIGGYERCGAGR